jgi:hypothetical protein
MRYHTCLVISSPTKQVLSVLVLTTTPIQREKIKDVENSIHTISTPTIIIQLSHRKEKPQKSNPSASPNPTS